MEATIDKIKDLRARTGAGISAVKEALENSKTEEEALSILREKGEAKAAKRAGKSAQNGVLGVYNHNNRMVVVVEVATETDFAARSEDMQKFANDLAVHIAASNTKYVSEESVPEEDIKAEKEAAKKDLEGKPKEVVEKIMEGKLQKLYRDNVLLHQKLFMDDSKTVQDYMNEMVAKIGEKMEVTRFVRMEIAQPTSGCNLD